MRHPCIRIFAPLLVCLAAAPAFAATHTIFQSGFTFSPADLTIAAGDTVVWQWSSGAHTVTNGTSLGDPNLGNLFDAALNAGASTFTHVFADEGVVPYLCRPHAGLGMTGTVTVEAAAAADELPAADLPVLGRNAPNPFNPRTEIAFALPADAAVRLVVLDVAGRLVRTLVDGERMAAGPHRRAWDGRDTSGNGVAAGVYLYVLEADGVRLSGTMALVK